MEDFIPFDPGVTADLIPGKIRKLETWNVILTACVIVTVVVAIHYAYQFHEATDEWI